MSHEIIILSLESGEGGESLQAQDHSHSTLRIDCNFGPADNLSEREIDKRIAKIRKTMAELEKEVCAPERVG